MISGHLSGNSGHSESSHMMEICATVDDKILDSSQTEVGTTFPLSNHGAIQIIPTNPCTTQEKENGDRAFRPRFDALNLPYQTVIQKFNVVEMTNGSSIEKSELSATGASDALITSQQDPKFSQKHEDMISGFGQSEKMGGHSDCAQTGAQMPRSCTASIDGENVSRLLNDNGRPASASSFVGSDPLQAPHSGILLVPGFRASPKTSAFLKPSSNLPLSPGTSHQFELESCEPLVFTCIESFKSTAGLSDDILSRSILKEDLETETKSDCCGNPESLDNISLSPPSNPLTTTRAGIAIDSDASEASHCSLTFADQLKQSHEETAISFVSDHSNVPSPPPITPIEYPQSGSYFEPAIIIRVHNANFTEAVGAQYLPSSSPPSSPSMNSHYAPSSSPLPTSSPGERSQISPPSSPGNPDEYIQAGTSGSGGQQGFYTDENYSAFPQYSMGRMYYKSDRGEVEGSLMQPGSTPELLTPSYPLDFFNQTAAPMGPPSTNEHYNRIDNSGFLPMQATFATNQFPISDSHYETAGYEVYDTIPARQEFPAPDTAHYEQSPVNDNAAASTSISQNLEPAKTNVVPRPKRPTLAGQRQQQKKLSKPFRSPVLHTPVRLAPKPTPPQVSPPLVTAAKSIESQKASMGTFSKTKGQDTNAIASSSSQTLDAKVKHRTTRAASQFKSPLPITSTPLDEATLVRLTPTIQSLERKLQLLRRALKVREDVQEEVLEGLVKKWSEAGREAAWEVWDVVKDNANSEEAQGDSQAKGKKRSIDESWGWDESGDQKKPKVENERNWGWDVVPVSEHEDSDVRPEEQDTTVADKQEGEEGDEDAPQPSLGTMLIQLGIAPETLGWDEEEGNFVDR